ncbi:MAG: hypothetical protein JJ900_11765 [Rhodospirillales bacterium]|nr:hypothetical protein [Rhodospirillales bacterium]MBO6787518.1 hypothetical protein [Rhodospirillales bacterium]
MTGITPVFARQSQELEEAQKRLLPAGPTRGLWEGDASLLTERGWKAVLLPADFEWSGVMDDEPNWPGKEGVPEITSYYEPLMNCLKRLGRNEFIMSAEWAPTEEKRPDDEAWYCRCPADPRKLHEAYEYLKTHVPGIDMCAFDGHEDWAVTGNYEMGYLLIAEPPIIETYCEVAGGEDLLRAWYYHYEMNVETYWNEETGMPNPAMARVYDMLGWPYPVYPERHNDFWDKAYDWSLMCGNKIRSMVPPR